MLEELGRVVRVNDKGRMGCGSGCCGYCCCIVGESDGGMQIGLR